VIVPQPIGLGQEGRTTQESRVVNGNGRRRIASRVAGVGAYVPERKISNDDVLERLKASSADYLDRDSSKKLMARAKRTLAKSGNVTRFWCEEDQYCTDIARVASERALEDAGIRAEEIDLIIFTGMSKAFVEPATAHILRHEIGATRANVIDTQDACTSFMKSMEMADSLIQTGNYGTVLIATGERTYDWADFACKTLEEYPQKCAALTIGDAAGAVVLQGTQDPVYVDNPKHMRFMYRIVDGTFATCHIGLNYRIGERYRLFSDSSDLVRTGLQAIMDLLVERLEEDEWKDFQYDNLFIHDIGKIIDELVLPFLREAKLCVPDTYRSFFPEYGNVACASLPLSLWLAKQDGRLKPGDLSVFVCPAAGVQGGVMVFSY
jgi:3-oxoacyl-[acyl-carrier-protein] synthase-3